MRLTGGNAADLGKEIEILVDLIESEFHFFQEALSLYRRKWLNSLNRLSNHNILV